jgi:hypothetical protein
MYVIHSIQEANRVHGTEEEKIFRERYAQELQKKKWQLGAGSYSRGDEMAEEM